MENSRDVMKYLDSDLSMKIILSLEDPSDLIRFSATSRYWRCFVIENRFCKLLCLKKYLELANFAHIIEKNNVIEPIELTEDGAKCLERDHKVYAFLARGLNLSIIKQCITKPIKGTRTEKNPKEGIECSWFGGHGKPAILQSLHYKLASKFCVMTEIHVRPFKAFIQLESPAYAAKAMRFRFGHKVPTKREKRVKLDVGIDLDLSNNTYVWTYTSPEYPMAQENGLHVFKLPEPILCIGGVVQVQMLGAQTNPYVNTRYYLCITHVRVVGRPLHQTFDVEIIDNSGRCKLKYEKLLS